MIFNDDYNKSFLVLASEVDSDLNKILSNNLILNENIFSIEFLEALIKRTSVNFLFFISTPNITISNNSLKRFLNLAASAEKKLLYSDYFFKNKTTFELIENLTLQFGSVRNDFEFGKVILVEKLFLEKCISDFKMEFPEENTLALYFLQLEAIRKNIFLRINEPLYTVSINDKKHNSNFDYVDPKNKGQQLLFEKIFTNYLKKIQAYLPERKKIFVPLNNHKVKASVIIPVKNRIKTIEDAIVSAISQKTNFQFNIIIVDNHSEDGTTDLIKTKFALNPKVIHLIPEERNLGIGGCWNYAIDSEHCGQFVVQLDSDDLYINEHTLQRIVNKFEMDNSAMVIGSYNLTDFEKKILPPGLINHDEWTDKNGHNNALRINGLGAPRAFATEIIRKIKFPDVSYGEDYAAVLAITRIYKISRIYEPLYICRRWAENSDSNISRTQKNKHDFYKDSLRTIEILSRQRLNAES